MLHNKIIYFKDIVTCIRIPSPDEVRVRSGDCCNFLPDMKELDIAR